MKELFFSGALLFLVGASIQAEPKAFRFTGPNVVKLDWNAKCMVSGDLNGDGKIDLAVVNPERARIDILYRRKPGEKVSRVRPTTPDRWEPDLEDAPYLRETIPYDGNVANLALGDLDLDGRVDLVYGGAGEGALVRFREKDNTWSDALELDVRDPVAGDRSLTVRDLDGDGRAEVIVFSEQGLQRVSFDGRKPKVESETQKLSSTKAGGFHFVDYDGDNSDDLLYLVPRDDRALRSLRWSGAGFLSEISYPVASQSLSLSKSVPVSPGELSFASVIGESGELVTLRLRQPDRPLSAKNLGKPRIHNIFSEKAGAFLHAIADFDKDGLVDLVAVAPKEAELRFLRGRKDGQFESFVAFPFLRGVSALAAGDFDGDGKASLLVSSKDEGIVGLSRLRKEGRFGFPEPLAIEDDTVALACADLDDDGRDEALLVTKKKYDYRLVLLQANSEGVLEIGEGTELEDLERDPSGLFIRDFDGDGDRDLLVLSGRDPALLLLRNEKGQFEAAAEKSLVRKSVLQGLAPSRLGWGDVDRDGREDLLVGGKGFVRAVGLRDGDLKVLDQFNARSGDEDVRCPRLLDLDGDGESEAFFYVPSQGAFQVLERSKDGVFRYSRSIEIGEMELSELLQLRLGKPARPRLLAFGGSAFWSIPMKSDSSSMVITSRHETDLKDISYSTALFGDFDADGDADVLALDNSKHLIEFLRYAPARKSWESVLHFHVFVENLHYRGRKGGQREPREVLVEDLNGDGKDDFALLVHDRLLTYLQE